VLHIHVRQCRQVAHHQAPAHPPEKSEL
jgi:hypothetical protein